MARQAARPHLARMDYRTFAITGALTVGLAACGEPAQSEMPVPAAATVPCEVRWVHDGDTMRCAGYDKSTRLYGIDAPEMQGACREGRECVDGDPIAARDHLAALVAGREVLCDHVSTDRYRRPVMRCYAARIDISCAMVQSGHAVKRYGNLQCRPQAEI